MLRIIVQLVAASSLLWLVAGAPAADDAAAPKPFDKTTAVSESTLERITGKSDLAQVVVANNASTVSNNTVEGNSVTGKISFDGQAFGNLRGLSVVSANTGNNVSINASLNVNVAVRPE